MLAGGYPCCLDDAENDKLLNMLLYKIGIDTFVCLQSEVNLQVSEAMWRAGRAPRPYIHDARRLLQEGKRSGSVPPERKVDFLHLPIPDGGITSDEAISTLADDCNARIRKGERLYIHCWGGHGRTGTLVAIMLSRLYQLHARLSLMITQAYHDARQYPQNMRSPSSAVQRQQVLRILEQKSRLGPSPSAAAGRARRVAVPSVPKFVPGVKHEMHQADNDSLAKLEIERPKYKLTKQNTRSASHKGQGRGQQKDQQLRSSQSEGVISAGHGALQHFFPSDLPPRRDTNVQDESGGREKRMAMAAAALRP